MDARRLSAPRTMVALLGATGLAGAALLAVGVLATGGCYPQDGCSAGVAVTRCAGLDLQQCSPGRGGEGDWEDLGLCGTACTPESCPAGPVSVCVTNPQGKAFCAISPTPIPPCVAGVSTTCWLNDVVSCDPSGYVDSVLLPCGKLHCAISTSAGGALCAASAAPVPECSHGASTACWNNQRVQCDPTGYVRSVVQACGDLTCVDTPGCGPLCVLEGGPNPLCTPTTASVCAGATPTDCQCGYSIATHPACGSADLCKTTPPPAGQDAGAGPDPGGPRTSAFCVLRATPVPGCPSTGAYTICMGSTLVQCNDGWATAETSCPGECHAYGGVGACG